MRSHFAGLRLIQNLDDMQLTFLAEMHDTPWSLVFYIMEEEVDIKHLDKYSVSEAKLERMYVVLLEQERDANVPEDKDKDKDLLTELYEDEQHDHEYGH